MNTGTVLERVETKAAQPRGSSLQARYERALAEVRRMGDWLEGPQGRSLTPIAWEEAFRRYRRTQARLRRLGDELRPVTLRDRREVLSGEALTAEVLELFA
jgi:hypothetical protein